MELNLDWQRRTSALWPQVGYEIRPLRVWAFQELIAFWEAEAQRRAVHEDRADDAGATAGAAPPRAPSLAASTRLMAVAQRILPDHVRGLEGLQLRCEGATAPATVAQLCEEAALLPLAAEIVAALVEISALGADAEKN